MPTKADFVHISIIVISSSNNAALPWENENTNEYKKNVLSKYTNECAIFSD